MSVALWPDHLLTLDEWDALPADNSRHYELVEGVLVVSPRAILLHQWAVRELANQLQAQLPAGSTALTDAEVTIDPGHPPTVRGPDVLVLPTTAIGVRRARCEASELKLAVEIVSEGSVRTDRVTKLHEYAEAGIPNYWIIDLDDPVSIDAYGLVDGEYELLAATSGTVELSSPSPLTVDLPKLVAPR